MGIKGLMKVINDNVPTAIKKHDIKAYFGRKIAIDASMCMYQFIVAVRTGGENLANDDGEITSHLQGMFYRTLRLLDFGIKPVYVFDGKPPEMKSGELEKRKERRDQAEAELKIATEAGNAEDIEKFNRRLVKVTKQQNEDCKELLRLMGIPVIEAPCEAEATCAALAKHNHVYAVGTEDMDALTFGAPRLLRYLMSPASLKQDIHEIDLESVLAGLGMDMTSFIDFCVLLGCDYTGKINGIGPQKALELIREYKTTEEAIKHLEERYKVSDDFLYEGAAKMFTEAEVVDHTEVDLKWGSPDEEGLVNFLCEKHGFAEARVLSGIERMKKSKNKGSQKRIENFFTKVPTALPKAVEIKKRKAADTKVNSAKKKK